MKFHKLIVLATLIAAISWMTANPTRAQKIEIAVQNDQAGTITIIQNLDDAEQPEQDSETDSDPQGRAIVSIENINGTVTLTDSDGNQQELDLSDARGVSYSSSSSVAVVNGKRVATSSTKISYIDRDGKRVTYQTGQSLLDPKLAGKIGKIESEKKQAGKFMVGIDTARMSEKMASELKIDPDAGLIVVRVSPDSPAASEGIQIGDVLLFADGTPLVEMADLTEAVGRAAQENVKVSIILLRDGKEITVEATPVKRPVVKVSGEQKEHPLSVQENIGAE